MSLGGGGQIGVLAVDPSMKGVVDEMVRLREENLLLRATIDSMRPPQEFITHETRVELDAVTSRAMLAKLHKGEMRALRDAMSLEARKMLVAVLTHEAMDAFVEALINNQGVLDTDDGFVLRITLPVPKLTADLLPKVLKP